MFAIHFSWIFKFFIPDSPTEVHNDIENNNDEHLSGHLYLHPSMNRWHSCTKNHHIIMDDDLLKTDFRNFNNNGLYMRRLTTTSPAESIVSAPLTPTGNLIVNILGNLDNQSHDTDIINQKNLRNSTNCVIGHTNDNTHTPIIHRRRVPTVALTEHQLNGTTKTVPITSKTSPNGTVQCVTIAINNNDTYKSNNLYCNRGYSLSNSAPQCINCWSGST